MIPIRSALVVAQLQKIVAKPTATGLGVAGEELHPSRSGSAINARERVRSSSREGETA